MYGSGELEAPCRLCNHANSVIVVVSLPYDRERHELRATIARKIGILAEGEVTENGSDGISPERETTLPNGWPMRELTLGQDSVIFAR